ETLKRMVGKNKKHPLRVLAISSGKGGVGKTNVVTNLAYALSKKGRRVLVFDADMGLGNIHILLGLAPKFNLEHVLSGQKTVAEIIVEGPVGIRILPAGSGVQELTQLTHEARLLLLEEFDRISQEYDFLMFDTGAGISSNVTYFCSAANETILIATTEPTSLTDVYALMKVLYQKHNQKYFRLIVNSVKSEKEALEIYRHLSAVTDKFLSHITVEYLGHILTDPNVSKAVRQQRAFMELYPHSKVSQCINELCNKIVNEKTSDSGEYDHTFLWKDVFQVQ
ncbi:MAG: flagellar synthesis regulator FleN, partial [Nitrospinae bacterium RIFCSPLOWO2_12_FULL_47_7]